ncbi:DUF1266 domain-containing protein [Maribacter algarum]|uniref:DUF1266 domain-containing protein n=1 Tax=Maribacter algarum (ex Zhang et al. 2020) TaxID=2578118 RepID=A0A5S3PP94_9FLAO|nr:DUF1266 domain-containing protein [Maribacter algarum]TMM56191.1 DUF1266 domain-containing protein [Maribacter algarum]
MNVLKKTSITVFAILFALVITSCGSSDSQIKDEQLSGFMLGGIYFFNGYGGADEVKSMMSDAGYTSNADLVSGYKEILEFPFEKSQAAGIKSMFREMWDVTNKASLVETIQDLKTREHEFKAWDYARIVNNACMGYAAGYLSKDEVISMTQEVLPLAREKYPTWDAYYTDFNKGRIDWNENDPEAEAFQALSENMTKGDDSIFKIIPLNAK